MKKICIVLCILLAGCGLLNKPDERETVAPPDVSDVQEDGTVGYEPENGSEYSQGDERCLVETISVDIEPYVIKPQVNFVINNLFTKISFDKQLKTGDIQADHLHIKDAKITSTLRVSEFVKSGYVYIQGGPEDYVLWATPFDIRYEGDQTVNLSFDGSVDIMKYVNNGVLPVEGYVLVKNTKERLTITGKINFLRFYECKK